MKKTFVICGCSYSIGCGCTDLYTQPFGIVTAKNLDWNVITLARGGASNYAIHLQGMFAADLPEKPHMIVLSPTSYDRVDWVKDTGDGNKPHTLLNLNYHQYPPHNAPPNHINKDPLDFYLKDNPEYDPFLFCDQVGGIDDYLKVLARGSDATYYKRFQKEDTKRLTLIRDYYIHCMSNRIKINYDIGSIVLAYTYIRRKGINCYIMTEHPELYNPYMDKDVIYQNWLALSNTWPDVFKSGHTSEIGHLDTATRLTKRIKDDGLE